MRILRIGGRNLASLAGEFELRLDEPPLQDEGLFAITGPTGSGKSTLLDAICLALYGQIPRLPGGHGVDLHDVGRDDKVHTIASNDIRSILRRGTASAYAEVDFRTADGKVYRSRWSVRRARGKPGGRLQPYQLSLEIPETGEVLAASISEHRKRLPEIIGLRFDQFRRSVLLAQGDFANFLKADANDRAMLLERITGTEIYSELSMAAYRRAEQENRTLRELQDRLQGIELLDEPQRSAIQERLQSVQQRKSAMDKEIQTLEAMRDWYVEADVLRKSLDQAQSLHAEREADWRRSAREREMLSQREEIAFLFGDYQTLQAGIRESSRLVAQLQSLEASLLRQRQESQRSEQDLRRLDEQRRQALAEQTAAGPELRKARRLDVEILAAEESGAEIAHEIEQADERSGILAAARKELQQRQRRLEEEMGRIGDWLDDHAEQRLLAEQWPRWEALLQDAESTRREQQGFEARMRELDARQRTLRAGLSRDQTLALEAEQALAALEEQLATREREKQGLPDAGDLQDRIDAIRLGQQGLRDGGRLVREYDRQRQHLAEAQRNAQELQNGIQEDEQRLGDTEKNLLRCKGAMEEARLSLRRLESMANDTVEGLRAELRDAEPCPVCGSVDHPFARMPVGSLRKQLQEQRQRTAELEQQHQQSLLALADLRNRIRSNGDREQRQRQQISALQQSIREGEQAWRDMAFPDKPALALDDARLREYIEHRMEKFEETRQILERQRQQLRALITGIERGESRRRKLAGRLQEFRESLSARKLEQEQLLAEIALADAGRKAADEDWAQCLARLRRPLDFDRQWRKRLAEDPSGFRESCAEIAHRWQKKYRLDQQLRQQSQELQPDLVRITTERDEVTERRRQLSRKLARSLQVLEKLRRHRAACLQGQEADRVERRLQAEVDRLGADHDRLRIAHQQRMQSLVRLETRQADLLASSRRLQTLTEQRRETLRGRLQERGISWDRMQQLFAIEEQDLRRYRDRRDNLQQQRTRVAAVLAERREKLRVHEERAPQQQESAIVARLRELATIRKELDQEWLSLSTRLKQDGIDRQRRESLLLALEEQRQQWKRWETINELIGSANGQRFRKFAQSLTLDALVGHANRYMADLSRRYLLQRVPGADMELQVLDRDLGDEIRTVHGLSGGETFLVSLALALGLASLSSQRLRVESLFIDEGFGTLDANTLDMAVNSLDALQAMGRQVGIISHVGDLVDNIRVQVRVRPRPGGHSRLSVHVA